MTTNRTRSEPATRHHRTDPPRLRAALAAAARGWPVFPLYQHKKKPAITDWERRATTDERQLRRWWATAPYNIGVPCGPAGIVVIDLDVAHGTLPSDWAHLGVEHGRDVLAILADRAGEPDPIDTYSVISPTTGEHRYFEAPPDIQLRNTIGHLGIGLGPLIDVRAHGGFIVAAGSLTVIDGAKRRYRTHPLRPHTLQPLPQFLITSLTPPPPAPRAPIPQMEGGQRLANYIRAALDDEARTVAAAAPGTRAGVLFRSAAALGSLVGAGALDEQLAERVLLDAAQGHNGIDRWNTHEAQHHIRNGLAAGKSTPRAITNLTA
ncbi:hypothetical protein [Alloactinosynnema sp. L-07]|uniref:bifunctional DNA primase/polymerase n=1 Tax=Alloactinosynnema sp. L-07 TaxID=1653480 RepID=UPI00065F0990|nr:bifunctional DNA primase/polymerase [Alloactinosynnema sp. L-07]CRK56976.1 hypothetical protein [Alloactinosynnema sp. L-07]